MLQLLVCAAAQQGSSKDSIQERLCGKYPLEGRLWGADSGLGGGGDSAADMPEGWHLSDGDGLRGI